MASNWDGLEVMLFCDELENLIALIQNTYGYTRTDWIAFNIFEIAFALEIISKPNYMNWIFMYWIHIPCCRHTSVVTEILAFLTSDFNSITCWIHFI